MIFERIPLPSRVLCRSVCHEWNAMLDDIIPNKYRLGTYTHTFFVSGRSLRLFFGRSQGIRELHYSSCHNVSTYEFLNALPLLPNLQTLTADLHRVSMISSWQKSLNRMCVPSLETLSLRDSASDGVPDFVVFQLLHILYPNLLDLTVLNVRSLSLPGTKFYSFTRLTSLTLREGFAGNVNVSIPSLVTLRYLDCHLGRRSYPGLNNDSTNLRTLEVSPAPAGSHILSIIPTLSLTKLVYVLDYPFHLSKVQVWDGLLPIAQCESLLDLELKADTGHYIQLIASLSSSLSKLTLHWMKDLDTYFEFFRDTLFDTSITYKGRKISTQNVSQLSVPIDYSVTIDVDSELNTFTERVRICKSCGRSVHEDDDHLQVCPSQPLVCPTPSCSHVPFRTQSELDVHLSSVCTHYRLPCFYCAQEFGREEIVAHLDRHQKKTGSVLPRTECLLAQMYGCDFTSDDMDELMSHSLTAHEPAECFSPPPKFGPNLLEELLSLFVNSDGERLTKASLNTREVHDLSYPGW
eukprot:TRINITY_DN10600_c0_g1_i2.p1 TRINITY_DN10600_c0_g1~~TRINITY_DN10600_c0_g1_i2.p1  ORF type:complete len:520 (-),score=89.26 TRINITY_DN10600_c0_g1_i2:269-1828(-)